jgi:hypothetical protein
MRLGGEGNCQLLLAVYPAFVRALPVISTPPPGQYADNPVASSTLALDNLITELRDEIKKIGISFNEAYAECELQDELYRQGRDAVDQVLFHFEDLVHDSIMDGDSDIYGNEVFF